MTYTKHFIYNLLNLVKISQRKKMQFIPNKELTPTKPLVKELDHQPQLFNKSKRHYKIDYP